MGFATVGGDGAEDEGVADSLRSRIEAFDQVAVEGLLDFEGDPEEPGVVLPEQPCSLIGAVAEVVGDLTDAFAGLGAGAGCVAHDDGHQGHRNPGRGRHVGQRGASVQRVGVACRHPKPPEEMRISTRLSPSSVERSRREGCSDIVNAHRPCAQEVPRNRTF